MRRHFVFLLLIPLFIVAFLPCLALPQGTPSAEMKSLKIGVISPLSGPFAYLGMSVLRGSELAVRNVNDKGTIGKGPGILAGNQHYKLEIVSYDDSGDPAKSVAGMRKLVEMHKVSVVLGPLGTPQVWACQEINVQLRVLFNGMSASDQSRKKGNPLYIQERVPALHYGEPMAQVCIDRGYKKACVLTDISDHLLSWGKRFKENFESLGGQVVGFESIDQKNLMDYHSVMTNFKAKNPDIIFVSLYEEAAALAANHALDLGYKGKFLFTSDWGEKAEKMVGLNNVQGSLVQAFTHTYYRKYPDQDKRGISTAFHKQYLNIYKEEYGLPATSIYDPALMFARAMEIANTVTDPYAIRAACPNALQEGKLSLLYPNNNVLKNGLMVGAPELLLEVKGNGYSLVKELRVAKEVLE